MTDHPLTLRPAHDSSFLLPAAIQDLGQDATRAFVEFFAASIRNANTRAAYLRAAVRFLEWLDSQSLSLRGLSPVHVAAYVELLGTTHKAPSVKQHLAALRMLCDFLVLKQVIVSNPAAGVKSPKHIVRVGKTPVLAGEDARELFASIDVSTPSGLRDRALIGVMVYTFARVSAVLGMDLGDYYQNGRRMMVRLLEKGGKPHEMPAHHTLVEYMDAYLGAVGKMNGALFRSLTQKRSGFSERRMSRFEALAMVKRRCRRAGLGDRFTNHTFRATGITAYLKNGGQLDKAQFMANHASAQTTKLYDRTQQETTLDEVERIIL